MTGRAVTRTRGHTLLELIIALAVLSTTLIIASELLLARSRQMSRAGRTAHRMSAEVAFDQLRQDLRNARAVGGGSPVFAATALILDQPAGAVITWRLDATTLLRGRVDAAGDQGERPALDRVARFAWRLGPGSGLRPLVEVEIGFEDADRPIGSGPVGGHVTVRDLRQLAVALRGSGGRSW